jgi:acyl carrier protein
LNTRNEVADKVLAIVADSLVVPRDKLVEQTLIVEELEASSMDVVTLVIALDDEFGIEFDMDDIPQENVSVGWIIDYITGKSS